MITIRRSWTQRGKNNNAGIRIKTSETNEKGHTRNKKYFLGTWTNKIQLTNFQLNNLEKKRLKRLNETYRELPNELR